MAPLFLRVINGKKWLGETQRDWLTELEKSYNLEKTKSDFRTPDNLLSVWLIKDDKSNLDRVLAALAANREEIKNLDFILLNQELLFKHELIPINYPGKTPDEKANLEWHYNLTQISVDKIVKLSHTLLHIAEQEDNQVFDSREKGQILNLLTKSVQEGFIDLNHTRLKSRYKQQIQDNL